LARCEICGRKVDDLRLWKGKRVCGKCFEKESSRG
jgi:formylmethanofuran dehydrogenase subunit E